MNDISYIKQMTDMIDGKEYGSAFIVSDFTHLMDYETAKKSIARLEKKNQIRRVLRGIYDKPRYSKLLKEFSAPNPEQIAKAIARSNNWKIAACGDSALNLLGLSTQVPANWKFISSGPYKTYPIGNIQLDFIHRADREIQGMSEDTILLIQAIKALGQDNIKESDIRILKKRYAKADRTRILEESRNTVSWIYEIIKKIFSD